MFDTLYLTSQHWQIMQDHVARQAPLEACGLLAGKQDQVEVILLVPNAADSKVRFRMSPKEQWQAFLRIDQLGLELLGIFHSHPAGPVGLSPTDIAEVAYRVVQVIWSSDGMNWQACGFWIEAGEVRPVTLQIDDDE